MVYVFFADGFEESEALVPIDLLRRSGVEVRTVGITGKMVTGAHQVMMAADILPEEMELSQAEMIFLPGGMPGTEHLRQSMVVDQAMDYCIAHDLYMAAICAAPSVFYGKGLLNSKKVSCHTSVEGKMPKAEIVKTPFSVQGRIITGRGMGAALPFGLELCRILKGEETVEKVKQAICYAG